MAKNVPETAEVVAPKAVRAGHQLVDIVTSGMYSNPLMVLREYVQNAADGIDCARESGLLGASGGYVEITIDGLNRRISIIDNGTGVHNADVEDMLCSLGVSSKEIGQRRGFRGIGRLGGIGYCQEVLFETRSGSKERIAVVTWHCAKLRGSLLNKSRTKNLETLVRNSVTVEFRKPEAGEPSHFFRATMSDVHKFHKDELMNIPVVRTYLGQVAPVPFDREQFPFAEQIDTYLSEVDGYGAYNVRLNGKQVFRPHCRTIEVSSKQTDHIHGIECFEIRGRGRRSIGKGWYAKSAYLASIPPRVAMRGIRVRQGNIEIGDEYYLQHSFIEQRFATWHVGEIHLGYSVKANARRDGFEQSPDYELFLEQTNVLGRHLSHLCLQSSKQRSIRVSAKRMLKRVESLLGAAFAVDEAHLVETHGEIGSIVARLDDMDGSLKDIPDVRRRLARARSSLIRLQGKVPLLSDVIDGRTLRHLSQKHLLEVIARDMINNHDSGIPAHELVARVFFPYLKRGILAKVKRG